METFKKALLFCLALLPIAILGGLFTGLYQIDLYSVKIIDQAIAQLGSKEMLIVVSVIQVCMYTVVCGVIGYIFSEKIGLMKSFKFEKFAIINVILLTVVMGVIFSLDYWIFGSAEQLIQTATKDGLTIYGTLAAVLYGGVIEEVMLRLFVMSFFVFVLWKMFFRKKPKEEIPQGIFITANVIAALLFAVGHLPATIIAFGKLTPLILLRCLLLNGGFGFAFGWVYQKYGIQCAMLSHMGVHIISRFIWVIFI